MSFIPITEPLLLEVILKESTPLQKWLILHQNLNQAFGLRGFNAADR